MKGLDSTFGMTPNAFGRIFGITGLKDKPYEGCLDSFKSSLRRKVLEYSCEISKKITNGYTYTNICDIDISKAVSFIDRTNALYERIQEADANEIIDLEIEVFNFCNANLE